MMLKCSRTVVRGLVLALMLGGCGNMYAGANVRQNGQRNRSEDTRRESGEKDPEEAENAGTGRAGFGSVPYFRDDSGSNTQLSEGWIYGYWSRQLCRVKADTLESEVLFETASPQAGFFSIWDGMIYFLEQKGVSFPEGKKANLWRMECDGSRRKLIAEGLTMPEGIPAGMEIYDGILYLLAWPDYYQSGNSEHNNRYFRLKEDGTVEQVPVSETLYGLVPEGWREARTCYKCRELQNLVYCVRNFGYGLLCDESGQLYRSILETGEMERIPLRDAEIWSYITLTNRALVYKGAGNVWYSLSMDDPEEVAELGEMDCYAMDFWDEKGIYSIDRTWGESGFSIERLNWNGERETLNYWVSAPTLSDSVYGDYLTVLYSDGDYLYYDSLMDGDGVICRTPLDPGMEAYEEFYEESEHVFTYYENPVKEISTRETFSSTFTVEKTGHNAIFSVTKVYLTEETEAADNINAFLEEMYRSEEEYIAGLMDEVREVSSDGWYYGSDMTLVEDELSASVSYLDDNYIGIRFFWYLYWGGAAHGQHGNLEYVFSRSSGKQLQLTDVLENSEEEICSIIAPYVEAEAEWGTDEEGWERIILEDGRFYLTPEGIGIHFDIYELTCYASGGLDVVVPYELFKMRDPKKVGLPRS